MGASHSRSEGDGSESGNGGIETSTSMPGSAFRVNIANVNRTVLEGEDVHVAVDVVLLDRSTNEVVSVHHAPENVRKKLLAYLRSAHFARKMAVGMLTPPLSRVTHGDDSRSTRGKSRAPAVHTPFLQPVKVLRTRDDAEYAKAQVVRDSADGRGFSVTLPTMRLRMKSPNATSTSNTNTNTNNNNNAKAKVNVNVNRGLCMRSVAALAAENLASSFPHGTVPLLDKHGKMTRHKNGRQDRYDVDVTTYHMN